MAVKEQYLMSAIKSLCIVLLVSTMGRLFGQGHDALMAKNVSDFKRLSGYAAFIGKSDQATMDAKKQSLPLSFDLNAVASLKGFQQKDKRDRFYYNRGIERSLYFKQNQESGLSIRIFSGSNGAGDAWEWVVSSTATSSSLPIDRLAAIFPLKEGIVGDFSLGTVDESGKCFHALVFCRENIGITLRTSDGTLDLVPFAKEIDASLVAAPSAAAAPFIDEATIAVQTPDSVTEGTAGKVPISFKSPAGSPIAIGIASGNRNARFEKIGPDSIMIIPQRGEGRGELGIVLYDTATLASKWITRSMVIIKK
jgi:hypothetical protein